MKKLLFLVLLVMACARSLHALEPDLRTLHNSLQKLAESVPAKYSVDCMLSSGVILLPKAEKEDIERLIRQGHIVCNTAISRLDRFTTEYGNKFGFSWTTPEEKIRGNIFFRVLERGSGPIEEPKNVPNAGKTDHVFILKDLSQRIIAIGDSRLGASRNRLSTLNIIIDSKVPGALVQAIAIDIIDRAINLYINRLREDNSDYSREKLEFLFTTSLDVLEDLKAKNKYILEAVAEISKSGTNYKIERAESDEKHEAEKVECGREKA
jgi:hypothetical protein